jgi:mannose-1-phosphate guanylyltransferase
MRLILLSGGSGKRLWPLSNGSRTKQFLKVLKNEQGERESMVQRIWRQLASVGMMDHAYIATCSAQVDLIRNHLGGGVPIIVEPERRDTFAAIALASVYLYSEVGVPPDETVCVLPVDPFVETTFFEKVKGLEAALERTGAQLALIGSKPTYPSEKYGYILPDYEALSGHPEAFLIKGFVEKPPEKEAERLMGAGALWNCGVFGFKLGFLLNLLKERGYPDEYKELTARYSSLPKRSFDYEVVEKAGLMVSVVYENDWKDLGTWNTLTEEMEAPVLGKGIIDEDCLNTHVVNELDIPVAVLGLSNIVVACSSDGILVSDKAASQRIKDLLHTVEHSPMYGETRWGQYTILDFSRLEDGRETLVKKVEIQAGKNLDYGFHKSRNKCWIIQSGQGRAVLDGRIQEVKNGDCLLIPERTKHAVLAVSHLVLIEVQTGKDLMKEDSVLNLSDWIEIGKLGQSD